jgi:hypothetical protein
MVTNTHEGKEFKDAPGKAFEAKPAPTAGATPGAVEVRFVTSRHSAEFSQPIYADERRLRLRQIFCGVLIRVKNGWSAARALRAAARRWEGRRFKTGRAVDFSQETLDRIFYRWRKIGEAAFDLHYVAPPKAEVPAIVTTELLQRAGQADIKSFSELFRAVCNGSATPLPSKRTIQRAIPKSKRQAISKLMRARRSASAVERKAARQAEREIKRAKAALEKIEREAQEVLRR